MEERVKDLNVRLQKKMQQHSLMTSMSGTGTAPDETVPLLSNTSIHANAVTATTTVIVKPASASQDGDLLSEHGTRYQLDDGIIPVDGNSDSGLASWSLTKSSKTSASDSEPFC